MKIISESRIVEVTSYQLCYDWEGASKHHGMAFDCNQKGEIDIAALQKKPAAYDNYLKCLSGEHKVQKPYIWKLFHSYREPAIGRCVCGCEVVLGSFTNTCHSCNRDYNSGGQELAHRSQWGEETGEHWTDCL